jgi:uncharacterized membrane protein YphA (DoxX/SURF4 family)
MIDTLFSLHSILRWIILIVAVIAIIKFAVAWQSGSAFKGMDRGLIFGFSGLMDLQAMLGLISLSLILWERNKLIETNSPICAILDCPFPTYAVVHGVIMLAATVIAHLPARWKNADANTLFRKNVFMVFVSLLLILIGIFVLRFRPIRF